MARIIPESKNNKLDLVITATKTGGEVIEVNMVVTLDRILNLVMIPEIYTNTTSRIDKQHTPVDYISNPGLYKIKDQTYIGTVSSLITDNIVDVYMIKRTYNEDMDDVNSAIITEQFLLVIPSLSLLDNADNMELMNRPLCVSGMVSLLRANKKNDSLTGCLFLNEREDNSLETYIKDEVITIDGNLTTLGMSLGGVSHNSVATGVEKINSDGKGVIRSDKIGITQFLLLGRVENIFSTTPIRLDISRILPISPVRSGISNSAFINVNKGKIGLVLDI